MKEDDDVYDEAALNPCETVEHFLYECSMYKRERAALSEALEDNTRNLSNTSIATIFKKCNRFHLRDFVIGCEFKRRQLLWSPKNEEDWLLLSEAKMLEDTDWFLAGCDSDDIIAINDKEHVEDFDVVMEQQNILLDVLNKQH